MPSDHLLAGAGDTMQLWDVARAERLERAIFARAEGGHIFGGERNPERRARFCCADNSEDGSRRRRGYDVDIPWRA